MHIQYMFVHIAVCEWQSIHVLHSHETTAKQNEDDGEGDGQAVDVVALLLLEVTTTRLATHPTREENAAPDKKANGNQSTQDHQDNDPRSPLDHLQPWETIGGNHSNWDHPECAGKQGSQNTTTKGSKTKDGHLC